ncbi:hypothetical protein AM493_09555 [Flavobacterium akiainvivens]|uniref:Uncharacterized protein n=1 Tax=Flavobacterium akiainvivens TaxID=1202724 RepID=A0A0N0RQP4_9FLAO|nr:hypothetical protein [Flavobacterium akiainvivens]KOS06249.1 hypothetical protein AM493_09555 [Flavobacterium akiainvivens]SFQ17976.1 hypothetical protein SAMN05444144_101454 [Flavobacterium akiainvivens]
MSTKDKNQTPAPKVSADKDLTKSTKSTEGLKAALSEAKKGAARKTSATKTAAKIQEGDLSKRKTEY